jgi:prepilin-type processing-associated H-X9-DG protein
MTSATWRRACALVCVVGSLAGLAWQEGAAEQKARETLPADLARISGGSAAFFSVRVADLWTSALGRSARKEIDKEFGALVKGLEQKSGLPASAVERVTAVLPELNSAHPLLFFATTKAFDKKKVFAVAVPGGKEEKYNGETFVAANERNAGYVLGERAFVIGTRGDIQTLIDGKGKEQNGLTPALQLAAKKHSAVGAVGPAALAKLKMEFTNPEKLGPFAPLLKAKLLTLAIDAGAKTTGKLRIAFADQQSAKEGAKAAEAGRKLAEKALADGIKELGKDKTAAGLVKVLQRAAASLKAGRLERDGSAVAAAVEMKLDEKTIGAVALDAVARAKRAAARAQSANNLKQIGLAMHIYLDANRSFPPQAIYDKDGKALLSWRVLLLPYLEQNELYKEFKLDEPWDSKHNKKLLAKMPPVFKAPAGQNTTPFGTFYQGFVGKGAFFEGKRGIGIADITDGTSNTIMVAEAAKDVPWSKPEDLPFEAGKAPPKLGGVFPNGFNAAFADGSVRFFLKTIKPANLRAYITRNGGEVRSLDD